MAYNTSLMDLNLLGMYAAALKGIRENSSIYLLLIVWGIIVGVIILLVFMLAIPVYLMSMVALSSNYTMQFYATSIFLLTILTVAGILSASTKAGVLAFGSGIRRVGRASLIDFIKGIFRFTFPLFLGGIIISMLMAIPVLAIVMWFKTSLTNVIPDIFSSGWNFQHGLRYLMLIMNGMFVMGIFQVIIFFWISPWDEMVVLYDIPFSDALSGSFRFVFSGRHFPRVLSLIVANVLIAQLLLIVTNLSAFMGELPQGFSQGYLSMIVNSASNPFTSLGQFILMPFFAYAQLFLLPVPESERQVTVENNTRFSDLNRGEIVAN